MEIIVIKQLHFYNRCRIIEKNDGFKEDTMEQYSTEEMNFCGNVKRLREHLQLSKDDMAKLCGVNALGIRGIEHGACPATLF